MCSRKEDVSLPGWSSQSPVTELSDFFEKQSSAQSSPKFGPTLFPGTSSYQTEPQTLVEDIIIPRDFKMKISAQQEIASRKEEREHIHKCFPTATCIQYIYLYVIICRVMPPVEPISIKGLIVEFYHDIKQFKYCPGQGGNPTIPDPLPRWKRPYDRFDAFESIK